MRRAHIKVKARFAATPNGSSVAGAPRMRQAVAGAFLICGVGQQQGMTVAASGGIRRGASGTVEPTGRTWGVRRGKGRE
jgi:hypothetical protein